MYLLKKVIILISILSLFSTGCFTDGCFQDDLKDKDTVSSPEFSVTLGTYYEVRIKSSTEGAEIKFTTDGTDPVESGTAIKGNTATAGLNTVIKACAYKEGFRDSPVTEFSIPLTGKTHVIKFKNDSSIENYYTCSHDCNGKKVMEIHYRHRGGDLRWFSSDDIIDHTVVYNYDATGDLTGSTIYSGAGEDGIWRTGDDIQGASESRTYGDNNKIQYQIHFDASGSVTGCTKYQYDSTGNVTQVTAYSDDGTDGLFMTEDDIIDSYLRYNYSDSTLSSIDTVSGPGDDGDWFTDDDVIGHYKTERYEENLLSRTTLYDSDGTEGQWHSDDDRVSGYIDYLNEVVDHCHVYTYDASGNLSMEEKYLFHSTDAVDTYTIYQYGPDEKIRTLTRYKGGNDSLEQTTRFTYNGERLSEKSVYTSEQAASPERYINYIYDASGNLARAETYMTGSTDPAGFLRYEYDMKNRKTREMTYINPGDETRPVTWEITIDAGVEEDGHYIIGDKSYDINGTSLSSFSSDEYDFSNFLSGLIDVLKDLYEETVITESSLKINGSNGGHCSISISSDLSLSQSKVTVTYSFHDFDYGADAVLNGTAIKKLEGTLSDADSAAASLSGLSAGDLNVTFKNPRWDTSRYLLQSYRSFEYNNEDRPVIEKFFNGPGTDGIWFSADDTTGFTINYHYDASSGLLKREEKFDKAGTSEYYYEYTYNGDGRLTEKRKVHNSGSRQNHYNGPGNDNTWFNDDDSLDYSILAIVLE